MIQVVRGQAGQQREITDLAAGRRLMQLTEWKMGHRCNERPMHIVKQRDIGPPGLFGQRFRTAEPVGPFERKRTAGLTRHASDARVLPVRGMDDQLPDVMAITTWSPRGLLWRHSADRTTEVGAVPGLAVVGLAENHEQLLEFSRLGFHDR